MEYLSATILRLPSIQIGDGLELAEVMYASLCDRGAWTLSDLYGGFRYEVPETERQTVGEYVRAHFHPLGRTWVNAAVVVFVRDLTGNGLLQFQVTPPGPGFALLNGEMKPARFNALVKKGRLSRTSDSIYVNLDGAVLIDPSGLTVYALGAKAELKRDRSPALLQEARSRGWIKLEDGRMANPMALMVAEGDTLRFACGISIARALVSPESRERLDALPWTKLDDGRQLNLSAIKHFRFTERDQPSEAWLIDCNEMKLSPVNTAQALDMMEKRSGAPVPL